MYQELLQRNSPESGENIREFSIDYGFFTVLSFVMFMLVAVLLLPIGTKPLANFVNSQLDKSYEFYKQEEQNPANPLPTSVALPAPQNTSMPTPQITPENSATVQSIR